MQERDYFTGRVVRPAPPMSRKALRNGALSVVAMWVLVYAFWCAVCALGVLD